jgi:methyl-accepting chemotaxis protein
VLAETVSAETLLASESILTAEIVPIKLGDDKRVDFEFVLEECESYEVVEKDNNKVYNIKYKYKNEDTIIGLLKNYDLIIEKMGVTTKNIENQNDRITETQTSFVTLEHDIKDTTTQINSVTELTNELDKEKKLVVDSICNLSAVCEENSASAEETTASVEELNAVISQTSARAKNVDESAKELMKNVSIFTV